MKPLFRIASLVLFLALPTVAEDPVSIGIRGALNAISGVSEQTAFEVRSNAAEMLSRYVKVRDGNHLMQLKSTAGGTWVETHGLRLAAVIAQPVTMADKANGIAECYFVSVDAEMYRTYDTKTVKWADWHNGRNYYLPTAIKVTRRTNGGWTAHTPALSNLIAFTAHGNPSLIPHETKPVRKAMPPAGTAPSSARQTATPANPIKAQAAGAATSPTVQTAGSITRTAFLVAFVAVGIRLFLPTVVGKRRHVARSRKPARAVPPPIPASTTPLPPTLPDELAYPEIDLMKGNSHLLTPAEQAFHAVLEPLVRHACAISTKVRLADLFSVTPGRGQQAAFNKISRKHIDFVLTEPATSRILCAIELDDSSHKRPDRIDRDDFVNELFAVHGMPLLRVPFAWTYNVPGLRAELLKAGVPIANAA